MEHLLIFRKRAPYGGSDTHLFKWRRRLGQVPAYHLPPGCRTRGSRPGYLPGQFPLQLRPRRPYPLQGSGSQSELELAVPRPWGAPQTCLLLVSVPGGHGDWQWAAGMSSSEAGA